MVCSKLCNTQKTNPKNPGVQILVLLWFCFAIPFPISSANNYFSRELNSYFLGPSDTTGISFPMEIPVPEICMLTVDTSTNKNLIIWEKAGNSAIRSYNIYREGNIARVFELIGNVPYDQPSVFIDEDSEPGMRQYKYTISAIDTAGNESAMSNWHTNFLFQYVSQLNGVVFSWLPYQIENESADIFTSVVIYRGTQINNLIPVYNFSPEISTFTDLQVNPRLSRFYYRMSGIKKTPCDPDSINGNSSTPVYFGEIFSNLEDSNWDPIYTLSSEVNEICYSIKVFPNPLKTESRIQWSDTGNENYELLIYDIKGTLIKRISGFRNDQNIICRETLLGGFYIIELRGSHTFYGKLLVE
jgi:hypothetical protein